MARVIFFGSLGDRVSSPELTIDLGSRTASARAIFDQVAADNPSLLIAQSTTPIKVACNQQLADWDTPIANTDELAFLPPVTGG